MFLSLSAVAAVALAADPPKPPPFELKDGDRVVWLGGTLVEREQRYGYWETALHAAFPKANFTVRNLGWSGDTVWGEARGRFDYNKPDVCFKQLVDQTLALKPTVILVAYGANESFEGEAGVPRFEEGLNKLLDALKPANARLTVLMAPPGATNPNAPTGLTFTTSSIPTPPPAPFDVEARNKDLRRYGQVVGKVAAERGHHFADLFFLVNSLTAAPNNGIHLPERGYQAAASSRQLGRALGLEAEWPDRTDTERFDPLRKAVIAKNQLFFHRWRPENETYLFGFRKHEQGKNAAEVAAFDPLVTKAEEDIARLKASLLK